MTSLGLSRASLIRWVLFQAVAVMHAMSPSSAQSLASTDAALRTARQIDQLVFHTSDESHSPSCDASTFHRRVHLDAVGRIASASVAREYARSDSPATRRIVIDRLVESAACGERTAQLLREMWFPQTSVPPHRYLIADTERWIAEQLIGGRPLNEVARELIAVPYAGYERSAEIREHAEASEGRSAVPRVLIASNQYQAARMAANVTGDFLGIDLSCAQCHDHPFQRWTQDEFWATAAFFQRLDARRVEEAETSRTPFASIQIPETQRVVQAALFTGRSVHFEKTPPQGPDAGRQWFASWVAGCENPFFARQTVSKFWHALIGEPLVASSASPAASIDPSVAANVLDRLSDAFVEQQFDHRFLLRCILSTRVYQLSSQHRGDSTGMRGQLRELDGEQLFDSLRVASGEGVLRNDLDTNDELHQRSLLCERLQVDRSHPSRTIGQSLMFLNGEVAEAFCDAEQNATVRALAEARFMSEQECVAALYWSVLNRSVRPDEIDALRQAGLLVEDPPTRADRYARVFWVLVNTTEFNTNY